MALHPDDALELMRLVGRVDLQSGMSLTIDQVRAQANCTEADAVAVLRFLRYLGQVEYQIQPEGEIRYQVTTLARN